MEIDFYKLSKSARIVISYSFGIAKSWNVKVYQCLYVHIYNVTFKDRIGIQNLLFNPRMFATDGCQILEDQLGTLCLASTWLTANNHALVLSGRGNKFVLYISFENLLGSLHQCIAIVSHSKDMGRQFSNLLVFVQLDLFRVVNWKNLIRIYCHKDGSSVGLWNEN